MYHKPVLLTESIEALAIRQGGIYVDATLGGGGHTRAILDKLGNGRLIAFDQDKEALAQAPDDKRLTLVHHNFRFLKNFLTYHQALPVDGILADLGISSHQIDTPERGFSTRFDGPLDLRMDNSEGLPASAIIQTLSEEELATIFRNLGEVDNARSLAKYICENRASQPVSSIEQFKQLIYPCVDKRNPAKYLAKVFQALRIHVNDELGALIDFLHQSLQCLKPGGRLVVISYHSLEDRLVKNFLKTGNVDGKLETDFYGNKNTPFAVDGKSVVPSPEELEQNPRSRSARLRTGIKK